MTIGETLYTKDKRFAPLHEDGSAVWILKLTHPQPEDSGDYECQVSYHDEVEKKLTIPFQLTVLGEFQVAVRVHEAMKKIKGFFSDSYLTFRLYASCFLRNGYDYV